MKRLRAVQGVNASIRSSKIAPRSCRQISTALHQKRASNPSPHPFVPLSTSALPRSKVTSRISTLPIARQASSTSSSSADILQKTPLYDLNLAHGAKMVPFGGYHMPVQYSSLSVVDSHNFTRSHASLFDVSHMVQHRFSGPGVTAFLERITPSSPSELAPHHSGLSTMLWPITGGIVDDTIITRLGPELFYLVTNAGCREKDMKYFEDELKQFSNDGGKEVKWEVLKDWGLVALQGPLSEEILEGVLADPQEIKLKELYFGQSKYMKLKLPGSNISSPCLVSRGGYTGEDGFEISIPPAEAVAVTESLLQSATPEKLQLAGLAARDSLRLEAGMALYGHDIDDSTTPVEATLGWVIGKNRRASGGFHGDDLILKQLLPKKEGGIGVRRRRGGLIVQGPPAREGAEIVDSEGNNIGVVTSGCPSPTLGKNIAMGYLKTGFHRLGTEVEVIVRGKKRPAKVTKMTFVPTKYHKGPA
ncbi:putative aminomethyltransferase, mitochondrial [Venustampulla echinocandica]|uniref:Aminomethyltransferase n=1 Tax=Venustampulla echinocandica TaxID=2656787 RepID=A0A370U2F2_9HELO|nr:putative aminomethyltransferase, mitochondrial [Venustampulla echinocandica]RDL41957.1 putative aminomethyltransferase, mitochondrial [Venustampulla echinocandica]